MRENSWSRNNGCMPCAKSSSYVKPIDRIDCRYSAPFATADSVSVVDALCSCTLGGWSM